MLIAITPRSARGGRRVDSRLALSDRVDHISAKPHGQEIDKEKSRRGGGSLPFAKGRPPPGASGRSLVKAAARLFPARHRASVSESPFPSGPTPKDFSDGVQCCASEPRIG